MRLGHLSLDQKSSSNIRVSMSDISKQHLEWMKCSFELPLQASKVCQILHPPRHDQDLQYSPELSNHQSKIYRGWNCLWYVQSTSPTNGATTPSSETIESSTISPPTNDSVHLIRSQVDNGAQTMTTNNCHLIHDIKELTSPRYLLDDGEN